MIVLVAAGDAAPTAARALDSHAVERSTSTAAVRPLFEDGAVDVAVLDCDVEGTESLIRSLRDGEFGDPVVPLVLLVEGPLPPDLPTLAFDERLPRDVRADDLRDAVEQAIRVIDYRSAVDDLYEECQARARAGTTNPLCEVPSLRQSRDRADALLDELLDTPDALTALLWTPDDRDGK